jgi:hypothetical protein
MTDHLSGVVTTQQYLALALRRELSSLGRRRAATPPGRKRLEAFSDAVFAMSITMLVLDIDVPVRSGSGLWSVPA